MRKVDVNFARSECISDIDDAYAYVYTYWDKCAKTYH
jgi:hypothetical protein